MMGSRAVVMVVVELGFTMRIERGVGMMAVPAGVGWVDLVDGCGYLGRSRFPVAVVIATPRNLWGLAEFSNKIAGTPTDCIFP